MIQPLSEPQFYYNWCGTEYLAIEDGKVLGLIQIGVYEMPLKDFLELPNCGISIPSLELTPTLILGNKLFFTPKNWPNSANIELTIYNAIGQLIYGQRLDNFTDEMPFEVELEGVSAGVYYCRFAYMGRMQIVKVVKVN